MTNTEKVAYIRGLAEGLELDGSKKEVKVLNAIIELLDDLSVSFSDLQSDLNDVAEQVDEVDADLGSLEEDFYGECDDDCDCCSDEDDDDDEDEDGCYYEVTCPNCQESICLSEEIIEDGQIDCPNCGETLEFDFEDECDCDDCHHDHEH